MKTNFISARFLSLIIGINLFFSLNAQIGQILWQDNFNSLDTSLWNTIEGNGCEQASGCGWGNQELEYYSPDNISITEIPGEPGNKALVIQAKNEVVGSNLFTSGKISSENKLAIKYGVIEVRMKTPKVETGLWPALWLLGTNIPSAGWPRCGEIDMMEMGHKSAERAKQGYAGTSANNYLGANLLWYTPEACDAGNPTCAASIANDTYYNQPYVSSTSFDNRFLIYRLYWDEKNIRFTVEDNEIEYDLYTGPFPIGANESAYNKPFFLLLNLAVGGNFTDAATPAQVTAELPASLYVDYIRVRKWNGKGEVTLPRQLMANAGADRKINSGESLNLDGSGSYGDIYSYIWKENGSVIANGKTSTVELTDGSHVITLTVSDEQGNTSSDNIAIQVGDNLVGEIIWEENFDSFDSNIWNTINGDGCDGESGCGFGNQELQYYKSDNVSIEPVSGEAGNNALVLEARQETMGSSQFTSGKITTENKLAIKYGVVEVRLKTPNVETGLWPAAWLLGTNHNSVGWPRCGEMDMMEMGHKASERTRQGFAGTSANNYSGANLIWFSNEACAGDNPTCAASIAYDTHYNQPYTSATPLSNRYLIYRMYWEKTSIRLTVEDNGTEYDLYTRPFPIGANEAAFQQPFYLLLNLAVGGNFTDAATPGQVTAPLPAKMYVDYIKVRKWKGQGEVSYNTGNVLANAGIDQVHTDLDKNGSEQVSLNASGSYGNIKNYTWSESGAQLATGVNPTINISNGDHYITFTASDSLGNISIDEVYIDVREIIWEDNFNSFDTTLWNTIIGDGCATDAGCGWGNQELEYYQGDNISIEPISGETGNNALVLEAREETAGSSQFTSGKITSENKMSLRYGLLELRMQSPDVETGLWPAAWLLGVNQPTVGWPQCGEIDMMEMGQSTTERTRQGYPGISPNNYVGSNFIWYAADACSGENPNCAASIAYDTYYNKPYVPASALNNRFVTYRLYWNESYIRFTVVDNGNENDLYTGPFPISATSAALKEPFYFLLNLAVGGNFTDATTPGQVTAPLPAKMLVDYVRLLKWNGKGEVAFRTGLIANAGPDAIVLDKDKNGTETVFLDGSESDDFNGTITSYSWKENNVEISTEIIPEIELNRGIHNIILTVTDNDGNTSVDEVIVTITSGGASPIADAGPDTTIYDDNGDDIATIILDGSASSDPNDSPLTYSWLENNIRFDSVVNPLINLHTGKHTITLHVTNEDSLTASDEIIVIVIDPDNNAPIANAGPDQSLNDDGNDTATVTLDASGSSDSDGSIVSYSWNENGVEFASGISPTMELSTGNHFINLEVTDDDGITSDDTVLITIIDPDNLAPVAFAGNDTVIIDTDRNGFQSVVLDASGSMDSDGTIVSYSWNENGAEITTGISVTANLTTGIHFIVLKATDNDGISGNDTVIIKVAQLPIADAGNDTLVLDTNGDDSEVIPLNGSESTDPFGAIVIFSWFENELEIATGEITNAVFSRGTHLISLEVTDDDGYTATDEVLVIVANPNNNVPTAIGGDDFNITDSDNSGSETVMLDGSGSFDSDGYIYSYLWSENGLELGNTVSLEIELATGEHTIILEVTDNEGSKASDTIIVTVKHGACNFEVCTGDYTARVVSTPQGTSIKFVPEEIGTGDQVCYLYYGTNTGSAFPANIATPYQPFTLSNVSVGQTVYFYYTYNLSTGGEQNTSACKQSFTVGDCFTENMPPVANAGTDFTVEVPVGNNSASVTFDGSGSSDPDGTISSYIWTEGTVQIATGVSPTINLSNGVHTIYLIVTDSYGEPSRDKVIVTLESASGTIDLEVMPEINIYPVPVTEILKIESGGREIEKIQLLNSLGSLVLEAKNPSQIDMSGFPEGLYITVITIEGKQVVRKIVKN